MPKPETIVVGAGTSGLALAASLTRLSIPYIIVEREDCHASLWQKYAYDRLHLHFAKRFCELPHMSFPPDFPNFVPKKLFIQYLDDYVSHFKINPLYHKTVEAASFDGISKKWKVAARNGVSGELEEYSGRFLVVATGETTNPFVPEIDSLDSFSGEALHSTRFRSGKEYANKNVLVVGSGNSGMEIALDLANYGAKTFIIVRSPVHFLSRGMVNLGIILLKHLPLSLVDSLLIYGIKRPKKGPFFMRVENGQFPVIDVGTCEKIKTGQIQVLTEEIESIKGNDVSLKNGKSYQYDTIVFCTRFKRSTSWLKGDDYLLSDDGIPKPSYPNHWKGRNGLYCVGLSGTGFNGAKQDALNIANDINSILLSVPTEN
ncbi:hypothetical protein UlMin_031318 [Ulmus minor]